MEGQVVSKDSVGISNALTLMLLHIQTKNPILFYAKCTLIIEENIKTLLIIKLPMFDLPMSRCDKSGKGKRENKGNKGERCRPRKE